MEAKIRIINPANNAVITSDAPQLCPLDIDTKSVTPPADWARGRSQMMPMKRQHAPSIAVIVGPASFPPSGVSSYHMELAAKTNAMRILEGLGIPFEVREYEVDPEDLSAETVAAKVGLPPEQVFKTLIVRGDRNGFCFAIVPGNMELDGKALAKLTGDRRVEMAPLKDVQTLTGYIRGGVTAMGAKKDYPVFADETIEICDVISISAGQRGVQLLLSPGDYLRAVSATIGPIAKDKSE